MQLSSKSKDELRALIENELRNVQYGSKLITLKPDLLEELIFEKALFSGIGMVKLPIWTGEFLRKIDLSKVNFDSVIWNANYSKYYDEKELHFENDIIHKKRKYPIDFSKTNAKINLLRSFDHVYDGCNFSFVDLSSTPVFSRNYQFYNCDLSYSNLKFDFSNLLFISKDKSDPKNGYMINCNLEGLDLSDQTLNYLVLLYYPEFRRFEFENFINVSFKDTKLKILYNDHSLSEYGGSDDDSRYKKLGFNVLKASGNLDGCYIDGVLLKNGDSDINEEEYIEVARLKGEILSLINNQCNI